MHKLDTVSMIIRLILTGNQMIVYHHGDQKVDKEALICDRVAKD